MYYLMNKETIVATFDKKPESEFSAGVSFKMVEVCGKLPYGFENINTWLDGRKSSKHNKHLEKVMIQMGCCDNEGFIRVTHAATINDTFWVKSDTEHLSWGQISLYRNQFTETISRLAFEGVGLHDAVFSSTSPELACEGSFRKCFRKETDTGEWGSDIFIYKRGSEGASNSGLEPYCEVMASEIAQIICPNAVSYQLTYLHDKLASRCNLFTNEMQGYVPFAKLADVKKLDFEEIFRFFAEHGAEQAFREMIVLDALCFNEDRHAGNFGMMFNNDTLELLGMSPIFDLNISLLVHVRDDELSNIGDVLYVRKPVFGDDFTRIGQVGCNGVLRDRVKDMRDFSFTFRGDDTFSPERVRILESIVRQQADAILSPDKIFTKDVFFSQKAAESMFLKMESAEAILLVNEFEARIRDTLAQRDYFTSVCEEIGNVKCLIEDMDGLFELAIDFLAGSASIKIDGKPTTPQDLSAVHRDVYEDAIQNLKAFMHEKQDDRFQNLFWLNGSGKSTFTGMIDPNGVYINADEITKTTGCEAIAPHIVDCTISRENPIEEHYLSEEKRKQLYANAQQATQKPQASTLDKKHGIDGDALE